MGLFNREVDTDCGKKPLLGKLKKAKWEECVKSKKANLSTDIELKKENTQIKNIIIISVIGIVLILGIGIIYKSNK